MHAILIIGEKERAYTRIKEEHRIPGPDVIVESYERFGIEEARRLRHEASLRPVVNQYRVFVLVLRSATHEAQNALLKLFEDPAETAMFYIILEREDVFIPTLRSRFVVHSLEAGEQNLKVSEDFLRRTYSERLAIIAERTKEKDNNWVDETLNGIEFWAERKGDPVLLRDILFARSYMKAPGASLKMLLEHLALTLPAK